MLDNIVDLQIADWVLKARLPEGDGPHPVILLVHGWTGDERSMWVFAPRLPRRALLVTMRAPFVSRHTKYGGYSWLDQHDNGWGAIDEFRPALDKFSDLLSKLPAELPGDFSQFGLVGFSQGAAFSFAHSLNYPERVERLASLAGFVPEGCEARAAQQPLDGMPVFIAHGTRDAMVPIARARQARDLAQQAGAQVSYCESDSGHKLGAECARELAAFFSIV